MNPRIRRQYGHWVCFSFIGGKIVAGMGETPITAYRDWNYFAVPQ